MTVEGRLHPMIYSIPGAGTDAARDRAYDQAKEQATAWIMRLASGEATAADAQALRRWRNESPLHRQAFAEAKLLWETLGPAAAAVAARVDGELRGASGGRHHLLGRRALIGGALAASVAAVGYAGSKPPFRLWPSWQELAADYRTVTGERRQLAVADDVSLILNTQTSIGVDTAAPGSRVIELISGEAAITSKATELMRVDVVAAAGRATAAIARFDVRRDGATVRVTCLDGVVNVDCHDKSVTVPPGHQVTYDTTGLRDISAIDLAVVTAWQHGQLIFRHEPLARVIEEVNRYRPGRIVLLNQKLGERDVVATFYLNRIDEVVAQLAQAFNASARYLPAGVVVLS